MTHAAEPPPTPILRARVTDTADLLPAADEARLESALADFEQETSHQIAVLTVPGLEGEPIETFALRVAERAELGQRGLDNGILLVVAAQERRARIEVGYGLEGVVPDAIAKRVLEDTIFPRFREGDFSGGIEAGVESLMRAARGEVVPEDRRPPAEPERDPVSALLFAALVSTLIVGLPLRSSSSRRGRRLCAPIAFLSGAMSGALTWGLLASLAWAGLGFLAGFLFALLVPLWGGPGPRFRGRGGPFGFPGGGGFGRGGFGGGGFSGGGGGFGGGGASGSW